MINEETAQFGLYVVTNTVADNGDRCAQFVGYFLTRSDMERYASEFPGARLISVRKLSDGTWMSHE